MRLVADTNTVVSGLLWKGNPGRLIELARAGVVELITSPALLTEFRVVLARAKFDPVLQKHNQTRAELAETYLGLCEVTEPAPVPPTVLRDPDDDAVLAAAVSGNADLIVSGDADLLDIGIFRSIPIVNAARAVSMIEGQEST